MPSGTHANDVPTISALLQARLDQGHSARELSRQAEQAGYTLSHQTISKIARHTPASWPDPDTIRGLAHICNVSERVVLLAYGRSFGLAVETISAADFLPQQLDLLPPAIQQSINNLLRSLIDSFDATSRPAPRVPERTRRNPNAIVGPASRRRSGDIHGDRSNQQ